jgi:hypothetical protein
MESMDVLVTVCPHISGEASPERVKEGLLVPPNLASSTPLSQRSPS